ncbi:MAG: hypothetical protein ACLQU2_16980, partial [Candidatus Binataceae bacterium]
WVPERFSNHSKIDILSQRIIEHAHDDKSIQVLIASVGHGSPNSWRWWKQDKPSAIVACPSGNATFVARSAVPCRRQATNLLPHWRV